MTRWALLPLKAAAQRKSRLASVLERGERAALGMDMLLYVADTVRASGSVDHIAVICAEPLTLPSWLVQIRDTHGELNPALTAAVRELQQLAATSFAVILPDLPLLAPADVRDLAMAGTKAHIAIASDKTGLGTNALWLHTAIDFAFQFGENSLRHHLASARRLVPRPMMVNCDGLAFDLDTPQDLAWINRHISRSHE